MIFSRSSHASHGHSPPLSGPGRDSYARRLSPNRTSNPHVSASEAKRPPSDPVAVPQRPAPTSYPTRMPLFGRKATTGTRRQPPPAYTSSHDPDAISPAVAALLAVTAIPPRKAPVRRKRSDSRRVSIDELVNEWKNDGSLKSTLGTSPVLGMLLEEADHTPDDSSVSGKNSFVDDEYSHPRSVSCDSVPSLDVDDMSLVSMRSPSTPGSLRSRRSISFFRKPRSLPDPEPCFNHPLASPPIEHDDDSDDSLLTTPKASRTGPRARSSFKSNLTTSLQALKNAALSSISSLNLTSNPVTSQLCRTAAPFPDDMLWSHPFLFPRLTMEIRPVIDGVPTEAERHYLNPTPLSFEEQEAPFQQALHAPYLAEQVDDAPFIPMQTYNRTRRKSSSTPKRRNLSGSAPDPQSEAGRALLGAAGVRQREVRENSDFLRVVVLEMNMRRQGKIESGRAKIWLPPRQVGAYYHLDGQHTPVPPRWVGVSAYN